MPRYHFDTERGASRYHDQDGIELPSIAEARQQLMSLLRDLTYVDPPDDLNISVGVQVRCGDVVVLWGTCALAVSEDRP